MTGDRLILLTGGSGQVGRQVRRLLDEAKIAYLAPSRQDLSLDDLANIREYLERNTVNCIVHLAAETNVDLCELEPSLALLRNYESTKVLTDYAVTNNARMIFVSSAGVVSGDGAFLHDENSVPTPANFYGITKLHAENYIRTNATNYLIVRAAWMLGNSDKVKKFAEIISDKLKNDEPVNAVFDKFGSLTSSLRLAELLVQAAASDFSGIVHCGSSTPCSRYDLAKEIAWRLGSKSSITPVPDSSFKLAAPRGFSEGLSSIVTPNAFKYELLKWEDELSYYLGDVIK